MGGCLSLSQGPGAWQCFPWCWDSTKCKSRVGGDLSTVLFVSISPWSLFHKSDSQKLQKPRGLWFIYLLVTSFVSKTDLTFPHLRCNLIWCDVNLLEHFPLQWIHWSRNINDFVHGVLPWSHWGYIWYAGYAFFLKREKFWNRKDVWSQALRIKD